MADGVSRWCFSYFSEPWQCYLLDSHKPPGFHRKYFKLCSEDEQRFHGFGTTWGKWLMTKSFLGWRNPLIEINKSLCIYICAVKISGLTLAINLTSITVLKIFNAIDAGAELGLATPHSQLLLRSLFFVDKNYIFFFYTQNVLTTTSNRRLYRRALYLPSHQAWINRARQW